MGKALGRPVENQEKIKEKEGMSKEQRGKREETQRKKKRAKHGNPGLDLLGR